MLAVLISAAALCAATDDARLVEDLAAVWERQRSAVATARFRARAFRTGDVDPLSEEQVAAAFNSVDLVERPDDFRRLVEVIWKFKNFAGDPLSLVEVTVEGTQLREREVNRIGEIDYVSSQGITVVGQPDAKQTSILRTSDSRWRIRQLGDFRFVPIATVGLRLAGRDGGRVHLVDADEPREELDVDEATGFAHSWRQYTNGAISQEILQFGPVAYTGDVLLPTACARLAYREGRLANADILVVHNVEINADLPSDDFIAKAPKGTLIVDARDVNNTTSFRARSDVDDVIKAFPLASGTPASTPQGLTAVVASLAVAGILVALLVFFYRRPVKAR